MTVAADGVDVPAEDAAVRDRAVDEHEHGEHDERDRDALEGRERVGERTDTDPDVATLAEAVTAVVELCERYDVDLDELRGASGFAFIAYRDAAIEITAKIDAGIIFFKSTAGVRDVFVTDAILRNCFFPPFNMD